MSDRLSPAEASPAEDALLSLLVDLVAGARRCGLGVSVGQLGTLVRAIGTVAVEDRAALRRLVGLTLATSETDVAILHALVDAMFPAARARRHDDAGSPPTVDELRALIQAALLQGDRVTAAGLARTAAALGDVWISPDGSAARISRRILGALDLSRLLAQVLAAGRHADALDRRLAVAETEAALATFENDLGDELRRRALAVRIAAGEDVIGALAGTLTDLLAQTGTLPLMGGTRDERERLRSVVRPLALRLATRARRRRRGGRQLVDVRRTLARSVAYGGTPVDLRHRRRRPRRSELVVLADVSGSMADYAGFTLCLLQALHEEIVSLRCYAFVDGAAEVPSELLARPSASGAQLPLVPGVVAGDGHSDYGAAFAVAERLVAEVLTPSSVLVVLGDGRSRSSSTGTTGEDVVRRLGSRVRRLYWLTPEPERDWGRDGGHLAAYRRWCSRVDQVATVADLVRWVSAVVLG